jgi:hypothetical protein
MNKLAFCVCLLAIGGVGAMGTNACSSSSNPGSGSSSGGIEAGGDVGGASGSSSGGGQDSSGSSSGGSSGSSSGFEAGNCDVPLDGAFSCGAGEASAIQPPNTQSKGCDQCIEGCCSFAWCACAGDSSSDDAGQSGGCLGFVTCVENCAYPAADSGADGGPTFDECAQQCGPAYLQGQTQEGMALLSCILGSCASTTQCGQ